MDRASCVFLGDCIKQDNWSEMAAQSAHMHVQDIAAVLKRLDVQAIVRAFEVLPEERIARVFVHLPRAKQYPLLQRLQLEHGRQILRHLPADDRTALFEALSPEQAEELLKLLSPTALRRTLKQLGYPKDSAGRLMGAGFVTLRKDWTLGRALNHLRLHNHDQENINTLYVTDSKRCLLGVVSLRQLVLEPPEKTVGELIPGKPISVLVSAKRTEAARLIQHYDINALPVIDHTGALLGVITVDDVMDLLEAESTEDFHKIGGVGSVDHSLRDASPLLLYRKRVGWLVLLVFINVFAGAALAYFEETISAVIALIFFLPLIVAGGGNAGSQTATLMVRALATGDVDISDWFRLWIKELATSFGLGLTMGAAVWGLGLWRGGLEVAVIVSASMVLVVIVGSMVGILLPFLLTRMNLDPAAPSAPLITSIADISGILIYFSIATLVLKIGIG